MPSGRRERGLTWWGLMVVLALSGAALAALGRQWSLQTQREREAELRFRGEQISQAVGRYRAARQPAAWPQGLQDLLEDRRGSFEGEPRHHLRRLWADPFTGRADWELLPAPGPERGFVGVRSRSDARRLSHQGVMPQEEPRVSDWRFVHHAPAAPVPRPTRPARGGTPP
jgi:type II secretory pathway pseudopilin PulG